MSPAQPTAKKPFATLAQPCYMCTLCFAMEKAKAAGWNKWPFASRLTHYHFRARAAKSAARTHTYSRGSRKSKIMLYTEAFRRCAELRADRRGRGLMLFQYNTHNNHHHSISRADLFLTPPGLQRCGLPPPRWHISTHNQHTWSVPRITRVKIHNTFMHPTCAGKGTSLKAFLWKA